MFIPTCGCCRWYRPISEKTGEGHCAGFLKEVSWVMQMMDGARMNPGTKVATTDQRWCWQDHLK